MRYIAFVTKGLEQVALTEIKRLDSDVKIEEVAIKRIIFDSSANVSDLISLKTIDDLGFLLGKIGDLQSTRQIVENLMSINFEQANTTNNFSITVSSARNKLKTDQIVRECVDYLTDKYQWHYSEIERTEFDLRVFIDQKQCYLSVRVANQSLHHRKYKIFAKPGSLKPTVAAAMIQLTTDFKAELKVVDNFCGSGTILCGAVLNDQLVYGGDLDLESVINTQKNLAKVGFRDKDKIQHLNATSTNWPDNYFDCAISNLPWNKQIEVKYLAELYEQTVREYKRILKMDGKLCLLITKPELMKKFIKQYFPNKEIKEYPIGLLGQNPTILLTE